MSEVCKSKTTCQAGIPGSGAGQFTTPTSVAVDSSKGPTKGTVYVGDAGTNVVQVFNSSGKYLATIDGSSTSQGNFVSLAGVAVDQNGFLDHRAGNGSVAQFNKSGVFLGEGTDPAGYPPAIASTRRTARSANHQRHDPAIHVHRRNRTTIDAAGHGAGARSADQDPRRSRR
jgi:hypothetical protein